MGNIGNWVKRQRSNELCMSTRQLQRFGLDCQLMNSLPCGSHCWQQLAYESLCGISLRQGSDEVLQRVRLCISLVRMASVRRI